MNDLPWLAAIGHMVITNWLLVCDWLVLAVLLWWVVCYAVGLMASCCSCDGYVIWGIGGYILFGRCDER